MLDMTDFYKELVDEIADLNEEVERLRAVAVEKRAEADAAHNYSVKMKQENDLLREALSAFVTQWNACGPNSDFGRYFGNVRRQAVAALGEGWGGLTAPVELEDKWDNA